MADLIDKDLMHILQTTPSLKVHRDELLQKCLRPQNANYHICNEYPLVLSEQAFTNSFCVTSNHQVIAHLNFLPQKIDILNGDSFDIALVGNVATHENFRGKGVMYFLFEYIKNHAKSKNIKAIILWSELVEFYQKLGFRKFGKEARYFISRLESYSKGNIFRIEPGDLTLDDLKELLALRYPCHTIRRSTHDFQTLLRIPDTLMLVSVSTQGAIDGFAIIGKGYDMVGVLHEWGAQKPEYLIQICHFALDRTGWDNLILLSPSRLDSNWEQTFRFYSERIEYHPVGLAHLVDQSFQKAVDSIHIWGLDAI